MTTIPLAQSSGLLIALKNVSKVYGAGRATTRALRGINLGISPGEFVAVMGPSGSGKSTCMNILGCLDTPTSGTYMFQGLDVGALSRKQRALLRRHAVGFVFQGFNLLNRTSALENVELPLIYRGASAGERRARAQRALATVGLAGWESHTPGELSGGQQQRVAIARAIVTNPTVLFADEPTGNLDSAMSLEIMTLLTALNDDRGITIIMVTHEREMARFGRRIVCFRDGRIDSDGHEQAAERGPSAALERSRGAAAHPSCGMGTRPSTLRTCTHPGGWVPAAPPCRWTSLSSLTHTGLSAASEKERE